MSFVAASALKKFLSGKPTTQLVLLDEDGCSYLELTEAEWAKRKVVPHYSFGNVVVFMAEDLAGGTPDKMKYDDNLIPVSKVTRINLIEVAGNTLHPDDVKKLKKQKRISVNLVNEIGYTLKVSTDGIKIGCQDLSWAEWERNGQQTVDNYFRYRDQHNQVKELLTLVLANKDKIVARLTGTKKTVAKKAAKKTTKRK